MAVRSQGIERFESLQYLEGRKFSSLESAACLLQELGNPQDAVPAIHVGGTNGKGSVCALLSSMLFANGFNVGQTCSPHLVSVTERCLINGAPVDEESFGQTIEEVMEVATRNALSPSYFVLGLVAAFLEFKKNNLSWIVVEVGLGGLLDATNLIRNPRASVITGISEDHMELLGPTLVDVAKNKAGIAKRGVPMFVGKVSSEVRKAIEEVAEERGAVVEFAGREFSYHTESDEIEIAGKRHKAHLQWLPLNGNFQKENALLAVRVAYALGLEPNAIARGLRQVRWPGRLELFHRTSAPDVLFDVGHNPEGIDALCGYLETTAYKEFAFVLSILERKNWQRMLDELRCFAEHRHVYWIFTNSRYPGTVPPEELCAYFKQGESIGDPEEAFSRATRSVGAHGLVVVSGSLFLVGKLRPLFSMTPIRTFERVALDGIYEPLNDGN